MGWNFQSVMNMKDKGPRSNQIHKVYLYFDLINTFELKCFQLKAKMIQTFQ